MRRLRIVASVQLSMAMGAEEKFTSFWELPQPTQIEVLALLGRLIARGVVAGEDTEASSA